MGHPVAVAAWDEETERVEHMTLARYRAQNGDLDPEHCDFCWRSSPAGSIGTFCKDHADMGPLTSDVLAYCALSQRVDKRTHTFRFDGDDPYIVCCWCNEVRDAHSGHVIKEGLRAR